jgi:hypothetical protein
LLQSGQESLYAPDSEYMSRGFLCVGRFPIVFFVRRAILRSVRLKMFVMYEVSLLIYVNLAHFGGVFGSVGWAGLRVWGLMGKVLFCRML